MKINNVIQTKEKHARRCESTSHYVRDFDWDTSDPAERGPNLIKENGGHA